jgi:protein SCO1/2
MPSRLRLVVLVCSTLVIATAALVILLARPSHSDAGPGLRGALFPRGIKPAQFTLPDSGGKVFNARALRGRVSIVTFVYSTCQDTCPLTAEQIRGALDQLGKNAPPAVAISVLPSADTPFHVHRFLVEHRLLGRMTYLVGTRKQLAPVWKEFAIAPEQTSSPHSVDTVVLDRRSVQRVGFDAGDLLPEDLAHDVRTLQREG